MVKNNDKGTLNNDDVFYILAIHLVQSMDWKEKKVTPIYTPLPYLHNLSDINKNQQYSIYKI